MPRIPQKLTVLICHSVLKPVDLFKLYLSFFQIPYHMPSAGSPNIYRKIILSHIFTHTLLNNFDRLFYLSHLSYKKGHKKIRSFSHKTKDLICKYTAKE